MYQVLLDNLTIHDPALNDPARLLLNGVVTKKVNCADNFSFIIYPDNVGYDNLHIMKSVISVYKDGQLLFHGRPLSEDTGWDNEKKVFCEGDLAIFNDTVIRPYEFDGTVGDYVRFLVNQHNAQTTADKQVTVRTVTVTDPNNRIIRSNTDYACTMRELMDKTVGILGGYLQMVYENDGLYLDYLADSTSGTNQALSVGKNILDFQRSISAEALATALIPLGAKDESTGERLTIKSVNGGKDYITDSTAVSDSGLIFAVQTWDDVTVAANLLTKARALLTDLTRTIPRIQFTAVDLTDAGYSMDSIGFFEYVTVVDSAHNVSGQYLITERQYNLSAPENDKVTFGSEDKTISGQAATTKSEVTSIGETIINQTISLIEHQTELLKGGAGGYFIIGTDTDGHPSEIYFLDTDSRETARSILRLNRNGIGFSTTGIEGPYTNAWTIDGNLNASFITTGILNADLLKAGVLKDQNGGESFSLDLATGDLHIKIVSDLNNKISNIGTANMILNTLEPAVTPAANRPRIRGQVLNTTFSAGTAETTDHGVTVINTGAVRPYIRFGANSITAEQAGLNGLMPGKTYTFSCDARWNLFVPGASGTNRAFTVNLITNVVNPDEFKTTLTYPIPILPEQFGVDMIGRVEFTFTVPETATKLYLWATGNIATASTYQAGNFISLANIKLETGQVATGWSPAPEDMEGYTQTQIDISANAIKTEMSRIYETKTDSTTKIGTAKTEAINAAAVDATSKANAAKNTANSYTDGKLTSYSTTVEMETALTQTVEGIESRAAATYTTKEEFDDLSIGGKNLLPDSDAPTLAATYKPNGAITITSRYFSGTLVSGATYEWISLPGSIPAPPISAENCAHYVYPAAASYANALAWRDRYVPMVAGQTYTLSGWFYVKSGGIRVQLQYGVSTYKRKDYTIMRAGDRWVRHSWTFVADASYINPGDDDIKAWTRVYVGCGNIANEAGEAYVTGFQLEIGNRATAWNPYTQDLKTRVDKAETTITQNSEQILLRATKEEAQNYASTAENAAITAAAADATSKANAAKTAAINAAASDATTKADKAKSDAIQAANAATDQKLVNYSTTTEMNSAINVKADAIEQSVAATYTTKAEFENLNVGGINYLLGTQKMAGWPKGGAAVTVDDTGEYAIATLTGSSSNWSTALSVSPARDISILDGSSFTFSMQYSVTTDTIFSVVLASTARTPGSASGARTKYATFRTQTIPSTDGAWKTWSYTVDSITPEFMTSGSGDQNSWYITVYCRTRDAKLKIQKLKFEKGNKATDWSPAPEDVSQGAIDYTNNALTSYTTKTELASSLETTTEGILGTVSETYTTKTEFANLEIGGRNYLQFSDDPESWGWYTPTEYAVAKIFLYSNLVKEKKYTLTVYGQAPTRSDKTNCWYRAFWGGGNVDLGRIIMNNGRGVLTFTAPNSEHADTQNAWIQIYNTPPKGASGTVYTAEITKVKLEEGDKATDWTPAPEDIEHEFTVQKQAILDITSDEITAAVTKSEEGQPIVNLLPSVYWREAASSLPYTTGGVKWTLNADGSLTAQLADGATAATANSSFVLTGNLLTNSPPVLTVNPSKKHVFYGCPSGGSSTTYRMGVQKWTEDNPPTGASGSTSYDYGSGVKLAAGFKWLYLYCTVIKNYTFPDGPVTFYPMLEVGQIAHGYVSSHNGSGTLTERIKSAEASISVQADQIASKVSTTDYNGNKIASLINQNATTIQINAQKIDLQGAVSFASFNTTTKDALITDTTTKNQYAQSTSDTTAPTSGWADTIPVYNASKKYIWIRVSTTKTYAGGKSETTTSTPTVDKNLSSAIEAAASAQSTANSAIGTTKSTQQYYLSTSATSTTGGSWVDTVPTWAANRYVWTRMKTESTQKDGTALTPVYSTAVYDKNLTTALSTASSASTAAGAAQSTANGAVKSASVKTQYYLSSSSTSATGGSWVDTVPTWAENTYVWTRVVTTTTPVSGSASTTYTPSQNGTYDVNTTKALSDAASLAEGISAINLVPIVYNAEAAYGTKRTTNGITFEVLGNGQIKVTGTATANATFYIAGTGLTTAVPQITLDPTKAYTLSGCPAGGSAGTYCLRSNFYAENSETSAVLRTDTGSGYTQAAGYYGASLYIRIENGYACPADGLIFKPMFEVGKVKHNYVSSRSGVQGLSAKAIKATVSCYYRSTTQSVPTITADTTIGTSYNADNSWTYLLPQPSKGKYFYTCERYTYADGSVSFSTVREMTNLSVTSAWCSANDRTLIDGASIFTGSITADKIQANSITADRLDLNDIFSKNITATNFHLTGGSISIDTEAESWDTIKLNSGSICSEYGPSGIKVFNPNYSQKNKALFYTTYSVGTHGAASSRLYVRNITTSGEVSYESMLLSTGIYFDNKLTDTTEKVLLGVHNGAGLSVSKGTNSASLTSASLNLSNGTASISLTPASLNLSNGTASISLTPGSASQWLNGASKYSVLIWPDNNGAGRLVLGDGASTKWRTELTNDGLVFRNSSDVVTTKYPASKSSKSYTASHADLVFGGTSTVTVTKWGHMGFLDVNVLISAGSTFNTGTDYTICTLDAAYKPPATVHCMATNGFGSPVLLQVTASGAVALYRYAGSSWTNGWIRTRIPLQFENP